MKLINTLIRNKKHLYGKIKLIQNYENNCIIKRKNDFLKDKLEHILSPQAKEYLKLEKELKKDLRRKLKQRQKKHLV